MDDLNSSLCSMLQEITRYNIENVTEMNTGFLLANILEHVDHYEFSAKDQSLNNWAKAKDRLENFLVNKGLLDQNLDFDLSSIRRGDVKAIISALLQILAILAVFNESNWQRILNDVDYITKITLAKFLDSMISDIREELKYTVKTIKSPNLQSSEDIKMLLQKLEKHEIKIESQENTIADLKAELERELQEKVKLTKSVEEKDKEMLEMQQIKNEALKLLECNYVGKRDDELGEDFQKKINKLNQEIDILNEKLLEARSQIIDKENEIDKMKLMQAFLEEKKTELEETNEQLAYYKKLADNLKKEKDISDAKLRFLDCADKNISKLKSILKEEKITNTTLKLKISELEQSLSSLQRQLGSSEDKMSKMKKSLSQNGNLEANDGFYHTTYIRGIEEENARLRQQVKDLITQQNEIEMKTFMEDLKDRESEMMKSQIKSLMIEKEHLAIQINGRREAYKKSMPSLDPHELELHDMLDIKDTNDSVILNNIRTGDLSWDYKDEEEKKHHAPDFRLDDFNLAYTAIMNYAYRDLFKQRILVPGRTDRHRDILKPFGISNLLMTGKE